MSRKKLLTKEIAEEVLAYADTDVNCYTCEYTSIEDAAAESLSKHTGDLVLNGLTSLSDAAAESLSKHEGGLFLRGLTSLSDAAAESLSKYKGSQLDLRGLTSQPALSAATTALYRPPAIDMCAPRMAMARSYHAHVALTTLRHDSGDLRRGFGVGTREKANLEPERERRTAMIAISKTQDSDEPDDELEIVTMATPRLIELYERWRASLEEDQDDGA